MWIKLWITWGRGMDKIFFKIFFPQNYKDLGVLGSWGGIETMNICGRLVSSRQAVHIAGAYL